jgi:asparagine synthase (glutamine-hydrolysing)
VALAREAGIDRLSTFSIGLPGSELDEGSVARRTADHFATEHHEWALDAPTGRALVRQFLESMDQPSVDGFNTFCVAKYAHDNGAKVVLSGLGGDEIFGGYSSFGRIAQLVRWGRRLAPLAPLGRMLGTVLEARGPTAAGVRMGHFLRGAPTEAAAYRFARGIFTPSEAALLARGYLDGTPFDPLHADPDLRIPPGISTGDAVSYLEMTRYMSNQLLRDSDVMSMAWGLELRVPLVDARLYETLLGIPFPLRAAHGKALFLDAVPEIPPWVAGRPKQGFTLPFAAWGSEAWKDLFDSIDASAPFPLRSWYRRWTLLTLESAIRRLGLDSPRAG